MLERHDEFNNIKRVSPKVINERRIAIHLLGMNTKLIHDNRPYTLFQVICHYGLHFLQTTRETDDLLHFPV